MQNGNIESFAYVTAIFRTPRVDWSGCVTKLIISDDMNSSLNVEFWHLAYTEGLVNYSLSTNSCVAMHLYVNDFVFSI